jgi:crotonobetainyl-CoA:carnitine CoA-transferase CaiB-like acyl-CoA transferase
MLGKRTTRLDLRIAEDRRLFEALLAASDVLVHGYRPGALDDLGFDLAARRRIKPGLIDVSLDAYGWAGPWSHRRGFDSLVQMSCGIAEAGMLHFGADRPKPLPVQALDHATGYLMAYAAIQAITLSIIEKQASSVRLSLAKTAEILMRFPQHDCKEMAPETSSDTFPGMENTGWGPARRLKPPLNIEGVTFGSDRPSMPLGSHSPSY